MSPDDLAKAKAAIRAEVRAIMAHQNIDADPVDLQAKAKAAIRHEVQAMLGRHVEHREHERGSSGRCAGCGLAFKRISMHRCGSEHSKRRQRWA